MICRICGTQIDDNMQNCPRCGQTVYTSKYQQPLRTLSSSSNNNYLIAALICIVIAFAGLFTDWLEVKVKLFSFSHKQGVDYSDIFEDDYNDTASYDSIREDIDASLGKDNTIHFSKTDYNLIKYGYRTMKWCSLLGYISLGIALVFLFLNKKLFSIFIIISSAGLVLAVIGAYIYCAKTNEYLAEAIKCLIGTSTGMEVESRPAVGAWLSAAGSVGASAICILMKRKEAETAW